ncbi:DNA-directed RNA polymerase subunit alpha [compost metagenome]
MESSESVTVLFNKSDKNKITVEDVKRKILENNNTLIKDSNLSIRSQILLRRHGIETVGQLTKMSDFELKKVRNFGERSIEEVKQFLKFYI